MRNNQRGELRSTQENLNLECLAATNELDDIVRLPPGRSTHFFSPRVRLWQYAHGLQAYTANRFERKG